AQGRLTKATSEVLSNPSSSGRLMDRHFDAELDRAGNRREVERQESNGPKVEYYGATGTSPPQGANNLDQYRKLKYNGGEVVSGHFPPGVGTLKVDNQTPSRPGSGSG